MLYKYNCKDIIKMHVNNVKMLYACEDEKNSAAACIRSMLSCFSSDVPTEEKIAEQIKAPQTDSLLIRRSGLLNLFSPLFAINKDGINASINSTPKSLFELLDIGYLVAYKDLDSGKWALLLGKFCAGDNDEDNKLLVFSPVYGLFYFYVSRFCDMWNKAPEKRDYFAVDLGTMV